MKRNVNAPQIKSKKVTIQHRPFDQIDNVPSPRNLSDIPSPGREIPPGREVPGREYHESNLAETQMHLKAQQQELFIKQLEYDVMKNMDTNKLNDLLLNQNLRLYDSTLKAYQEEETTFEDPKIKIQQLGRFARTENYAKTYLQNKRDIYQKIKPMELKSLTELYEQKKRTMSSNQVDNKEKLYKEYQEIYMDFLERQPEVEYDRRQLIQYMSLCHEMSSALGNVPTFDKPTIWDKDPLSEEDSSFVKNYCKQKMKELDNKYDFKQEEFDYQNDKTDIYYEVKKYLDTHYFDQL